MESRTFEGSQRRWTLALQLQTITLALVFTASGTRGTAFEFTSVESCTPRLFFTGSATTLEAANVGHCCALCAASSTCTVINYWASTRSCHLFNSAATGLISSSAYPGPATLIKVDVIVDSVPVTSKMQSITGVLMVSGEEEGYASYTLQKIISAEHCWRICMALTGGVCRMFAHHAMLLTCIVIDVDFYGTWTTASDTDPGWTSYYATQSTGWKLLYKISKGISVDASNAFLVGPSNSTASSVHMALNSTCSCYIRNEIVDKWLKFPITSVSLVLAKDGSAAKYVNFSTTLVNTAASFYRADNIMASSWTDLPSATGPKYMGQGTPSNNYGGRYFAIFSDPDVGCDNDAGWISVNGQGTAPCTYDVKPVPQFAYASGLTAERFASAAFADALLIYAKM